MRQHSRGYAQAVAWPEEFHRVRLEWHLLALFLATVNANTRW